MQKYNSDVECCKKLGEKYIVEINCRKILLQKNIIVEKRKNLKLKIDF